MSSQTPQIDQSWLNILAGEFNKSYFKSLEYKILEERKRYTVYPEVSRVYAAFDSTPFEKVRVVIIGQDPYHGLGQANGLSFSVSKGIKLPPSLKNIYKELESDLNLPIAVHGDLQKWASQGVLLLNAFLTVRQSAPASHRKFGWEIFTDKVIESISDKRQGIIFLLWGNFARSKKELIDQNKHFVLEAPHPSPFSAHSGFFGCGHFSRVNEILRDQSKTTIDWQL